MVSTPGFKPRPYRWQASALTTAPTGLLPLVPVFTVKSISSLFYEKVHSNGLRDPGGKAVAPGTASYLIGGGGGPSPRPGPNSPKAWLGTHVCLGCERLNPGWGGWVEFVKAN